MKQLEMQDSSGTPETDATSELVERLAEAMTESVSDVVAQLNVMETEIEQKRESRGEYLVAMSFDYDPTALPSKRFKPRDFKSVLKHPDLRVDHRRLSEDVKVALFNREADERKVDVSQLPFTHKLVLARMRDREQAFALATETVAEGYTVEQLQTRMRSKEQKADKARPIIRQLKSYQAGSDSSTRTEVLELVRSKELLVSELTVDEREQIQTEVSKTRRAMETQLELLTEVEHLLFEILSESMNQRKKKKD